MVVGYHHFRKPPYRSIDPETLLNQEPTIWPGIDLLGRILPWAEGGLFRFQLSFVSRNDRYRNGPPKNPYNV